MCKKDCNDCTPCRKQKIKSLNVENCKTFFSDAITLSNDKKTLISITDGVVYYSGMELGIEPFNEMFSVYRDPETIRDLAPKMVNLPITDDHISLDGEAYNVVGSLLSSEIEPYLNVDKISTIAIRNTATLQEESVLDFKYDTSLGFFAKLVPANESDPFDFKQINIVPHHLAIVKNGRCGEACKFTDGATMPKVIKKVITKTKFKDAESATLREVMEMIAQFPENAAEADLESLKALIPILRKLKEENESNRAEETTEEEVIEEGDQVEDKVAEEEAKVEESADEATEEEEKAMVDEEDPEVKEMKAMDSKSFKDAINAMVDSKVKAKTKEFIEVSSRAKEFLDERYDFSNKTTEQIMRDTLATQYKQKFADSELSIAFKMLKKSNQYAKFGDSETVQPFDKLKDQEY